MHVVVPPEHARVVVGDPVAEVLREPRPRARRAGPPGTGSCGSTGWSSPSAGYTKRERIEGMGIGGEQRGRTRSSRRSPCSARAGCRTGRVSPTSRAHSPAHFSSVPRIAKSTPSACEDAGRRPGVVLAPRVVGGVALDDPEDVDRPPDLLHHRHRHGSPSRPRPPACGATRPSGCRSASCLASAPCSSDGISGSRSSTCSLTSGQQHVGEGDPARALGPAVVAGDAVEQVVARQDLVEEALRSMPMSRRGRVAHHVAVGAGAGADAALDAAQQSAAGW